MNHALILCQRVGSEPTRYILVCKLIVGHLPMTMGMILKYGYWAGYC